MAQENTYSWQQQRGGLQTATQPVDYDSLAKQFGATSSVAPQAKPGAPRGSSPASSPGTPVRPSSAPAVQSSPAAPDYDALAKQFGATSSAPASAPPAAQEQPGLLERAYETSGLKGMVESAKSKADEDEAVSKEIISHLKAGRWGHATEALLHHMAGRVGEAALGPGGELIKNSAQNLYTHSKKAGEAVAQGDTAGAVENVAEAIPVLGPVGEQVAKPLATDISSGNTAGIVGDVAGAIPAVLGTAKMGAEGLTAPGEAAEAAIPKNPEIAGTELPRSVGQAAADINPTGIGSDIKGVEDVARRIPGSESLRDISTKQQGGAREILANKAKTATGAETSTTPESIEQNAANAAEAAKKAGSAKYEELGKAAEAADLR
jgi:hypothetical protein